MNTYFVVHKPTGCRVKFVRKDRFRLTNDWTYTTYEKREHAAQRIKKGYTHYNGEYWDNIMVVVDSNKYWKNKKKIVERVAEITYIFKKLNILSFIDASDLRRRLREYFIKDHLTNE